jgi:hypothetical protein
LKNRTDTSTRLVYPALDAGYRMLDTLVQAANPESAEYADVLTFLRKRLAQRNHVLLQKEIHPPNSKNPPKPSSAPNPLTVPLLVKTTPAPTPNNPNPKPIYPGKKRKIPVLDMARDFPFLRLGRPQPGTLNRVLTQKNKARTRRLDMVRDWNSDESDIIGIIDCEEEDNWEDLVVDLLDREILHPALKMSKGKELRQLWIKPEARETFLHALNELQKWILESTNTNPNAITYKQTLMTHGIIWTLESL